MGLSHVFQDSGLGTACITSIWFQVTEVAVNIQISKSVTYLHLANLQAGLGEHMEEGIPIHQLLLWWINHNDDDDDDDAAVPLTLITYFDNFILHFQHLVHGQFQVCNFRSDFAIAVVF